MFPPAKFAKISSMRGRGYCSARSTGLNKTLKSSHTRSDPFCSTTGTIGVAHLLYSTLDRIPSFSKRVNSASSLGRSAYGTWRGLWKLGWQPSLTFKSALWPLSVATPSENTDSYHCNNWSSLCGMTLSSIWLSLRALISPQSSWILEGQSRPNNAGPGVSTTCRVNSFSWPLNLTLHFNSSLGVIICPV